MKDKVLEIMSRVLDVPVADITDDASVNTIKSWDSMHHLLMILAFEEEFGVSFPDSEVVELLSLEVILAALDKKLQSR